MRTCSAIVPAAGLSSRYGGPNKLLQEWGDCTVVGTVVRALLASGLPVYVVTGRDADLVTVAVEPVATVLNPEYKQGLGTSIAAGVANAPKSDGYLIALGDMPGLRVDVVRSLLEAFETVPLNSIVVPVYADEPKRIGHPVLFGSAYRNDLLALTGDSGARSIIDSAGGRLVHIFVGGSLPDLDEPE